MKQPSVKFVILTRKTPEARKSTEGPEIKMPKVIRNLVSKDLTDKILSSAIKVHKKIGPGFHEKLYERAMAIQLNKDGIRFENQKRIDVLFEGEKIGYHFLDFLVEGEIIVELKTLDQLANIYLSQLISYLKAAKLKVGLVLNFATPTLEIKRVINSELL